MPIIVLLALHLDRLFDATFQTYAVNPSLSPISDSSGREGGSKERLQINQSW
jgi:hypothetical protein